MIGADLPQILHLGNMIFLFYFLSKLQEVFIQLYDFSGHSTVHSLEPNTAEYNQHWSKSNG